MDLQKNGLNLDQTKTSPDQFVDQHYYYYSKYSMCIYFLSIVALKIFPSTVSHLKLDNKAHLNNQHSFMVDTHRY